LVHANRLHGRLEFAEWIKAAPRSKEAIVIHL
jgi:hypothetical protein